MSPHLALVPFLQSWKQLQLAVRLFSYSKQGCGIRGIYDAIGEMDGHKLYRRRVDVEQDVNLAQRAWQHRRLDALLTLITTANETIALPRVTDLSITPL